MPRPAAILARMSSQADYLHEIGHLKRVPRSGWALAGIGAAESVAEHSHRVAVIAFLLATEARVDAAKCAALAVFHDAAETRLGDAHRLTKRYVDWAAAQEHVVDDQLSDLPSPIAGAVGALWREAHARRTPEAIIVRDADLIECLLQAREYEAAGHDVKEWIDSSIAGLSGDEAKRLANEILTTTPSSWCREEA